MARLKQVTAALGIWAVLLALLVGSVAHAEDVARGGTYKLVEPHTDQVMRTGRSKDLSSREQQHGRKHPELRFQVDRRTDNYAEQRGREQVIHERYKPPLNRINPISPTNPRKPEYMKAAENVARPADASARAAPPKTVGGVDMNGQVTVKEETKKPATPPVQAARPSEDAVFWDQSQPQPANQ